jgi:hypothetical protein
MFEQKTFQDDSDVRKFMGEYCDEIVYPDSFPVVIVFDWIHNGTNFKFQYMYINKNDFDKKYVNIQ